MSRTLPLPVNPSNFRDLSHVAHSARMRPGVLYRSDHLAALTAEDCRSIEGLGIRRVLDFRGVQERSTLVCALPGVQVHSLAIEPTVVQVLHDLQAIGPLTAAQAEASMADLYRSFVLHSTHRFAEFFDLLLQSDEPTVFHCTAGKDRTGYAAALVLRVLGASHDEIMRDYLLTNERFKPGLGMKSALPPEVAAVLVGVKPGYLDAAFEAVESEWGGFDRYVEQGLRLDAARRAQLERMYRLG